MLKFVSLFLFLLIYTPRLLAQFNIENIPDPRHEEESQYISDPDQILSSSVYSQLNNISTTIDSISGVEYIIVVVENYLGESIEKFTSELFNKWEVGKNKSDKGLLLLVVKNRGEYDLVSGFGLETYIPYKYLNRIGHTYLSPALKGEDFANGIQKTSQFILNILSSPDPILELEESMPEKIPFWSFQNSYFVKCVYIISIFLVFYLYVHILSVFILKNRKKTSSFYFPIFYGIVIMFFAIAILLVFSRFYYGTIQYIYNSNILPYLLLAVFSMILGIKLNKIHNLIRVNFRDEDRKQSAFMKYLYWFSLPLVLAPSAWKSIYKISKRKKENQGRFTPPDDSGDWVRVIRRSSHDVQFFLSNGQQREEKLQSRRYEIWRNESNGDVITIPWDIRDDFKQCPSCNYYTVSFNSTRVIKKATYSENGLGVKLEKCENCSYSEDKDEFIISQLRLKTSFTKRKNHLNNPNSSVKGLSNQ